MAKPCASQLPLERVSAAPVAYPLIENVTLTVACGWYGIQTWFGGLAMYTLLNILTGNALHADPLPVLGINLGQLVCFLAFWALQLYFVVHGTDSIRWLKTFSAPIKIVMCFVLVWWAIPPGGPPALQ